MPLPLSHSPRTLSQPEEIGWCVLPTAVDSDGVAQKEQIPVWGAGEGKGRGEAMEQLLFHAVSCLPRPHPGHKLLWVNEADSQ